MRLSLSRLDSLPPQPFGELSPGERKNLIKEASQGIWEEYVAGDLTQGEAESGIRFLMDLMINVGPFQEKLKKKNTALLNKLEA